jgi:hypothetical protein
MENYRLFKRTAFELNKILYNKDIEFLRTILEYVSAENILVEYYYNIHVRLYQGTQVYECKTLLHVLAGNQKG